MSGIYMGIEKEREKRREEKLRHERGGIWVVHALLGWSMEVGEGIFAGENGDLYVMSEDRQKSPLLTSVRNHDAHSTRFPSS